MAARAEVNERTSFRYFPDKREVLSDGDTDLRTAPTQTVAEAPEALEHRGHPGTPRTRAVRSRHAY
ncbi:hypothetical protein ABZ806_09765 [Spirillospora sp. NPDC047418]